MMSNKESGTKWTNEQQRAIDTHDKNLLVAAAAGSGKTAVLVERIIKMIVRDENPVDIDKLLVVTFTNAAASEMRERIGNAITDKLDKNPNNKRLQKQLTLLNKANITTMHSFCLDVIRNNFHHIDLDPNFRIGDQTEIILLKQDIVGELFEDKYEGMTLTDGFYKLVETFGGNKDDSKLQDMIEGLYNFSMSGPYPKIWLNKKAEEFNLSSEEELYKSKWMEIIMDGVEEELESMINSLHGLIDILKEEDAAPKIIDNLSETISSIYIAIDGYKAGYDEFQRSLQSITFGTLRMGKDLDDSIKNEVKNVRDSVKYKVKEMQKTFSFSLRDSYEAIKDMYPIMEALTDLVIEFMERYRNKKIEKGILDFNDLEHYCLKILNETYDKGIITPSSVAMEFKDKFYEVLVDEYQDSNSVQETIIDLVSRKNSDNPNVFMVGDVKQSIYRFRQAKPELFMEKYINYTLEESNNRKIQLYKNFRSRKEVIDGVNYIFKEIMSETVGELEYTDEEALNLGASYENSEDENVILGGPIEVNIIEKSIEESDLNKEKLDEEDFENEEIEGVNLEGKIVAKRIKELMTTTGNNVFKVLDKETGEYRPIKYKDIVILLRATKNWSESLLDELGQEGIPAYADTGSGYFESIEIRTIMSLLRVIDNPMQDVPVIAVLKSPIMGFSAEDLSIIRLKNKEKYFYENIADIAEGNICDISEELITRCKGFLEKLEIWRNKAIYMPIDEFIWYLYMDTAYYGYVGAMPNGVLRQANLKILFQRAKQFEQTSFKGLFNFINFINKLTKSSGDMGSAKILGENEDVVRIMSIHKSKGLEFPVVFLCGTGKQFNLMDLNKNILYHDELGFGPDFVDLEKRVSIGTIAKEAIKKKMKLETLSEEVRILYVACTRAKEKLIITGTVNNIQKSIEKWVSSASLDYNLILPSEILKGKSYLDWIGMSLCQHNDGKVLREKIAVSNEISKDDNSKWDIKLWKRSDIVVNNEEGKLEEEKEVKLSILEEEYDKDVYGEVDKRLSYKYPLKESTKLKSNISVSDLKKRNAEFIDQNVESINIEEVESKNKRTIITPKFLQEEKGLTAAEKGTAVHFVMKKIDLDKVSSIHEIKDQIQYLYENDFILEEEMKAVNPSKILNFFKSDLGKMMTELHKEGKKIYRELPFYTEISSVNIDNTLSEEYENEKVRLQGIIDCFFEYNGESILLDYKTDYVSKDNEAELQKKYIKQLDYYSDAVFKITGKKVSKRYLYSFYLEKVIEI